MNRTEGQVANRGLEMRERGEYDSRLGVLHRLGAVVFLIVASCLVACGGDSSTSTKDISLCEQYAAGEAGPGVERTCSLPDGSNCELTAEFSGNEVRCPIQAVWKNGPLGVNLAMTLADEEDWPYTVGLSIVPHVDSVQLYERLILDDVSRRDAGDFPHVFLVESDWDLNLSEYKVRQGNTSNYIEFTRLEVVQEDPYEAILEARFEAQLHRQWGGGDSGGPVSARLPRKFRIADGVIRTRIRDWSDREYWNSIDD